jgi:hypothetical protein
VTRTADGAQRLVREADMARDPLADVLRERLRAKQQCADCQHARCSSRQRTCLQAARSQTPAELTVRCVG